MPSDLNTLVYYVVAFVFVIALIAIGARLLKGTMSKGNSKAAGFLRGRERRIGVVQAASVDGRRKLILIKRDDVEHLIMTGGPVDVVVETGIEGPRPEQPPQQPERTEQQAAPRTEREEERAEPARDVHQSAPSYEQD